LSIFDQIVSLCGKNIKYSDVIENLNVLDYEYYFKTVEGALKGDVSTVLITFNEILEKGFDGHNYVSGLNSHLRDLLVGKDEVTLRLMEASPAVKQRYLQQSGKCSVDFLYRALEIGSNCDISYKNSKNPRLHVELSLISLCRITGKPSEEPEKKKSDETDLNKAEKDFPLPPRSEIIRQVEEPVKKEYIRQEKSGKHMPVFEKPGKTFSIKEVISDNEKQAEKKASSLTNSEKEIIPASKNKNKFTGDSFASSWIEFIDTLKGEGTRIISMFKAIKPELEDDHTIKIHLSNAAQKDIFNQNYRQKLINFLEDKFLVSELEIETAIDLSDTNELLYTDEQKYNYLQNKYPALKDFKKTFNLDLT
jgi:DNA polymerase-3 subunit gamma/tau